MANTPYFTKAESEALMKIIPGFIGAVNLTTPAPTRAGSYIPTESGTYANYGGVVINLTTGSAIIIYDGTNFSVQKTTIDLADYIKKSDGIQGNLIITDTIDETKLSETIKTKLNNVNGGQGYAPDDEDLFLKETAPSSGVFVTKFKDRATVVNGQLGYKIIRANFNFNSIPAGYENSIWEIRYVHDLGGATINLPINVNLLDKGGSFKNGILNGNNLKIKTNNITSFMNATTNGIFENYSNYTIKAKAGTIGDSGWWTKIATINFGVVTFTDITLTLLFQSSNAALDGATVSFSARQNATIIEAMYVNLLSLTSTDVFKFFTENGFKMVENGFGNNIDIWVRKNRTYGNLEIREISSVSSKSGTLVNYINNSIYVASTAVGNSEIISDGIKYDSQKFIFNKDLQSVDVLDLSLVTPSSFENNLRFSKDGARLTNIIERQNGNSIILAKTTIDYENVNINAGNEADIIDNKFHFKLKGFYWRRLFDRKTVDIKSIGGGSGGDDTNIIMKALTYNNVFLSKGIYNVRNLRVLEGQHLFANGEDAILRFFSSGNSETDSTSWTVISEGKFSSIKNLRIDGANNVGNGLLIKQNDGYKRIITDIRIDNFKSYVGTLEGGTFGITGDKSKADIRNGLGGNMLQIGENNNSSAAWELIMDNIRISSGEGIGVNIYRMTDSFLSRFIVGNICKRGFVTEFGIRNNKFKSMKIYRTSLLSITGGFDLSIGKIIPLLDSNGGFNDCAFYAVGENNIYDQIEIQENGSNGVCIGTNVYSLKNSSINGLIVDGNGGIDISDNNTVNAGYRRNGIVLNSYYKINIQGHINDFRTKINVCRQDKGIVTLTERVIINLANLERGGVYRIKTVGASGSFNAIQSDQLLSKSNAVGFTFTLSLDFEDKLSDIEASLGTGWELYLVNSFANIDVSIDNQYDQLQGNTGYDLADIGTNSIVRINNTVI
jgi:hypothetical protein